MQTKQDKNNPSPHEGSIPFTRYARQKQNGVVTNVVKDFSRPAFSAQADGDKRTMAATAGEGTAPKLGSGKCAGPTSASNSRVRCDVTAGETAKPFRRVFSRHADTVGLEIIRRVKWAVFPPRLSYWPAFFCLLLASSIHAAPRQHKPVQGQTTYDRAVNVTLDTVMWVHEQHRGKMTWLELNSEVCRHMKVRRTEPWARQ